ncbi:SAM-dependent methyltransferase [Nocardioides sp. Soil797]|nr:SAM-dependent methyltransferase [Nocardioides sp. Soil797]
MNDTERFNEHAATWDDDRGNVDRANAVAAVVRTVVPVRADMRALEIGGGTGLLARALADDLATVTVTDVAPGMVEAAGRALDNPRYDGWDARLYDIEHDPLPDERFDLVLGLLTLHHMGDVPAVVRRCAELLRPGGWIALIDLDHDPNGDFHASVHDFHGHDGFTRDSVRRWLGDAGFAGVTMTDAGTVTKEVDSTERDFPMFLATAQAPNP